MGYVCTRAWRDLSDNHLYAKGDEYPFDGRAVPAKRLQELEQGKNRAGLMLIQRVATEDAPEPAQEPKKQVRKAPAKRPSRSTKMK